MPIKLANNASTRLAAPLSSVATSITVESGGGDKFPVTGSGDYFPMTIVASDGQLEIVKCTARSGDTFTIERAQEGTTAKDFNAGAAIELRLTAGAMTSVIDEAEDRLQDVVDSLDGFKIGDYLTTARNPGANWLRRDGQAYDKTAYPELGALLPEAPVGVAWTNVGPSALPQGSFHRSPYVIYLPGTDEYVFFSNSAGGGNQPINRYTSPTGEVWTSTGSTGLVNVYSSSYKVVYGNGVMVIIRYGQDLVDLLRYSTDDGVTWKTTSFAVTTANIPRDVTFNPVTNKFIMACGTGDQSQENFYESSDGNVWTFAATQAFGFGIKGLYAADGKVFFRNSADHLYVSSNNMVSFTKITIPGETAFYEPYFHDGTFFIPASAKVYKSTDLVAFSEAYPTTLRHFNSYGNGIITALQGQAYSLDGGATWNSDPTPHVSAPAFMIGDPTVPTGKLYVYGSSAGSATVSVGVRALPGSFLVPNDNPINGWIKAK